MDITTPTVNSYNWGSQVIGTITIVLVALGGLYTMTIVPIQTSVQMLVSNREADRKEVATLYATIGQLSGDKELSKSERISLHADITKTEDHLLRIETEQKNRTLSVSSMPMLEKRIDALTERFNEAQQRSNMSPAEEIRELKSELQHIRDLLPRNP